MDSRALAFAESPIVRIYEGIVTVRSELSRKGSLTGIEYSQLLSNYTPKERATIREEVIAAGHAVEYKDGHTQVLESTKTPLRSQIRHPVYRQDSEHKESKRSKRIQDGVDKMYHALVEKETLTGKEQHQLFKSNYTAIELLVIREILIYMGLAEEYSTHPANGKQRTKLTWILKLVETEP